MSTGHKEVIFEQSKWDAALLAEATYGISRYFLDGFGYIDGVEDWPESIQRMVITSWVRRREQMILPQSQPEVVKLMADGLALYFAGPALFMDNTVEAIRVREPRMMVMEKRQKIAGRVIGEFSARVRSDIYDVCRQVEIESKQVYGTEILPKQDFSAIFGVSFSKGIYAKNFRIDRVALLG